MRRVLRSKGGDTDDKEYGVFDNQEEADAEMTGKLLPPGATSLNLVLMDK